MQIFALSAIIRNGPEYLPCWLCFKKETWSERSISPLLSLLCLYPALLSSCSGYRSGFGFPFIGWKVTQKTGKVALCWRIADDMQQLQGPNLGDRPAYVTTRKKRNTGRFANTFIWCELLCAFLFSDKAWKVKIQISPCFDHLSLCMKTTRVLVSWLGENLDTTTLQRAFSFR